MERSRLPCAWIAEFYEYIRAFGFVHQTVFELPRESTGLLKKIDN